MQRWGGLLEKSVAVDPNGDTKLHPISAPAVHIDRLTCNEAGFVGCKKQDDVSQLDRVAGAAEHGRA